ncbi:MAG TPA: sulfotransferase family protein [Arcobacter sp.]|nr:sulfotransferase family protein [Arcobacter sp.]
MNRQIITCTGYGGTGSSAITDLLKEFSNGLSLGDVEFWFLQDYNGISDLEYFLIDGNHRSRVNLAIKRFKKYIDEYDKYYSKFFKNYKINSLEYIENLIDAKFQKSISYYELDSKFKKLFWFKVSPLAQKIFAKILNKDFEEFSPYFPRDEKVYSIPHVERFYTETKKYTKKLFDTLDKGYDFIAIDQLTPAMNAKRYLNYVENLKVVIVDRDPRDLFLLNELHWKKAAYICDTTNIDEYISWYRTMREHKKIEKVHKNIAYIMFEDLIYNYDVTLSKLYAFFEIDEKYHTQKKKFFNPDISIQNTKLWERYPKYRRNDVEKIKKELDEYCFKK